MHYDVFGEQRSVQYRIAANRTATFNFVSPQGTQTKTYAPGKGGGIGGIIAGTFLAMLFLAALCVSWFRIKALSKTKSDQTESAPA